MNAGAVITNTDRKLKYFKEFKDERSAEFSILDPNTADAA